MNTLTEQEILTIARATYKELMSDCSPEDEAPYSYALRALVIDLVKDTEARKTWLQTHPFIESAQ